MNYILYVFAEAAIIATDIAEVNDFPVFPSLLVLTNYRLLDLQLH